MAIKTGQRWMLWGLLSTALALYCAEGLLGSDKTLYLPGETSHGHYQIEMACPACHGETGFGGDAVLQDSCVKCHGAELKRADDAHPKSKFTDPRNATRLAVLDARLCITCHAEHVPRRAGVMGVTLAADFCVYCHQDIAKDRKSHQGMKFDGCAAAGCHNYHDNRGLYEDFLTKHAGEPEIVASAWLPARNAVSLLRAGGTYPQTPLGAAAADAPRVQRGDALNSHQWAASGHAAAGVNCSACHQEKQAAGEKIWRERPAYQVCANCHAPEMTGFGAGRHGMRLALNLPAMRPAVARQPMKPLAHDKELNCGSCHRPHEADTRRAAVESCLGCHDDEHSRAYRQSAHFHLWENEINGAAPADSGVSCATCHLPRETRREEGRTRVRVQHNQNDNLRPNEKMLRSVCMHCHGLGYALDALADADLVRANFSGRPARHVESIEMAQRRALEKGKRGGDGPPS